MGHPEIISIGSFTLGCFDVPENPFSPVLGGVGLVRLEAPCRWEVCQHSGCFFVPLFSAACTRPDCVSQARCPVFCPLWEIVLHVFSCVREGSPSVDWQLRATASQAAFFPSLALLPSPFTQFQPSLVSTFSFLPCWFEIIFSLAC